MERYLNCKDYCCMDCAVMDCDVVKDAINKQIAIKVEEDSEGGLDWYCSCGNYLSRTKEKNIKYCSKCGQKLNWD